MDKQGKTTNVWGKIFHNVKDKNKEREEKEKKEKEKEREEKEKKEKEKKENEKKEKEKEKARGREREEYENAKDDIFDYRELKQYLNNLDSKKKNIILLSTGSYNPVHRMHIQIFNTAYNQLKDKFNVICCFISPSADCYVASKGNILIPFEQRCEMVYEAIAYYTTREIYDPNFRIFLHEWEGSHYYFIDFPEVINEIQYKINKYYQQYKIRVLYLCGMDHYLKCRYALRQNVVVIDRKPYKNTRNETNKKSNVFILEDEKSEPFSSTEIRDSFFQTGNLKEIEKITFPNVAKMVIDFYKKEAKKYEESNYHKYNKHY